MLSLNSYNKMLQKMFSHNISVFILISTLKKRQTQKTTDKYNTSKNKNYSNVFPITNNSEKYFYIYKPQKPINFRDLTLGQPKKQ